MEIIILRCVILGEMKSGKSMLLSCLVGSNEIDKGQIWVLGGKPKTKSSTTLTKYVGYMPQVFIIKIIINLYVKTCNLNFMSSVIIK